MEVVQACSLAKEPSAELQHGCPLGYASSAMLAQKASAGAYADVNVGHFSTLALGACALDLCTRTALWGSLVPLAASHQLEALFTKMAHKEERLVLRPRPRFEPPHGFFMPQRFGACDEIEGADVFALHRHSKPSKMKDQT